MDLAIIYNLLRNATSFHEFMAYNNIIHETEEENFLINNRKRGKIEDVKLGKDKILSFVNRINKKGE